MRDCWKADVTETRADRDAWKAKADKLAKACQATHDYFSYLCEVYHGERSSTGRPKVSSQPEIERLADRAGLLCKEALAEFEEGK